MSDWLTPDWPAASSVRAVCTTRRGGASQAPFDELNLALHVGDCEQDVLANRARLQVALGARPVFLDQVHGVGNVRIAPASPDGQSADVSSTGHAGVACTVMVADCLPVLLCDVRGRQVAAAHAGWRGLASGVLKSAVCGFNCSDAALAPTAATDLIAWLGPCIGPSAFEVGAEVRQVFLAHMQAAAALFKPCGPDKWLADLAGLARLQLRALGVSGIYGNDGSQAWCTVSNPSRFFSHRRDGVGVGGTGRFAACVWRVA